MWIRKSVPLVCGLLLAFNASSWASGPFQSECAEQDRSSRESLKDLKMCLEKANAKRRAKKIPGACIDENKAHETAVAALKTCLAKPSTQPSQKAEGH